MPYNERPWHLAMRALFFILAILYTAVALALWLYADVGILLDVFVFGYLFARTAQFVRFVQVKEYRWDRIVSHVRSPSGKKVFAGMPSWIVWAGILGVAAAQTADVALVVFLVTAAAGLWRLRDDARLPVWTVKASALLILAFALQVFFYIILILTFAFFAFELVAPEVVVLGGWFVIAEFAPAAVFAAMAAVNSATRSIKTRRFRLAKEKISLLKTTQGLRVVGITGSYGKTTTKEFLIQLLKQYSRFVQGEDGGKPEDAEEQNRNQGNQAFPSFVLGTPAHVNAELGIANFILAQSFEGISIFVVELGAYRIGEMKAMCEFVQPDIGIVTGINEQHIDLFGSFENIVKAKYELIQALPAPGIAIFNGDNEYTRNLKGSTTHCKSITYGLDATNVTHDVYAKNLKCSLEGCTFSLSVNGKSANGFSASLVSPHLIENLIGALAAAWTLGIEPKSLKGAIALVRTLPHTFTVEKRGNAIIVDDSYNANPEGVKAALRWLQQFSDHKKIVVFAGLLELGKRTPEIYRQLAEEASGVDLFLMTSRDYSDVFRMVLGERFKLANSPEDLNAYAATSEKILLSIIGRSLLSTQVVASFLRAL